jgi:hypothetical protein
VPKTPVIFKDSTIQTSIYVNDAGKAILEERLAKHGLAGMGFRETGLEC